MFNSNGSESMRKKLQNQTKVFLEFHCRETVVKEAKKHTPHKCIERPMSKHAGKKIKVHTI